MLPAKSSLKLMVPCPHERVAHPFTLISNLNYAQIEAELAAEPAS
jgi:hypothetical protein